MRVLCDASIASQVRQQRNKRNVHVFNISPGMATDSLTLTDSPNTAARNQQGVEKESVLRRFTGSVESCLRTAFFRLRFGIAQRPWTVVLVMTLLALTATAGVLRFKSETRINRLWVPQKSRAQDEKDIVEAHFGDSRRYSEFLFVAKEDGGDIGTKAALLSIVDVMTYAESIEGEPVAPPYGDGTPNTFQERCVKSLDSAGNEYCFRVSAFDLFYDPDKVVDVGGTADNWASIRSKLTASTDAQVKSFLLEDKPAYTFFGAPLLPHNVIALEDGNVTALLVLQLANTEFRTRFGSSASTGDRESDSWELALAEQLGDGSLPVQSESVAWYFNTVKGMQKAFLEDLIGDLDKFAIGLLFLFLYAVLFLREFHAVLSQMILGLVVIGTAGISVCVTFGLSSLAGWFFGPVHSILPLLIFGVCVDDMFVVARSLRTINRTLKRETKKDVPTRMGVALSKSGTAILVTSATNFFVFLACATSRFPALRSFSLWACLSVLIDFILSTTIFVAALAIDQRRIDKDRRDCCNCFPAVKEPSRKNWFAFDFGVFNRWFSDRFGPFILSRYGKIAFLALFTSVLAGGAYGCSQLHLEFEFARFFPSGSDPRMYADELELHFKVAEPSYVYLKNTNVSSTAEQKKLWDLCRRGDGAIAKSKWVQKESLNCWYEALRASEGVTGSDTIAEAEFNSKLGAFLETTGAQYGADIIRDETGKVKISRIGHNFEYTGSTEEKIERLMVLRKDLKAAGFPAKDCFSYEVKSIFIESLSALPREVATSLLLSLASVGLVTFVLIGHALVAFISMIVVGLILVNVVGFMYFSGYNLNIVSMISLSVAVGFSCDVVVHIARSFMEQVGSRRERAIAAHEELGPPVFHAVLSTVVAVLAFSAASSYIVQSLFSGLASILTLAAAHGLILLPILLSLFGPDGFYRSKEDKEAAERTLEETCIRAATVRAEQVDSESAMSSQAAVAGGKNLNDEEESSSGT